VGPADLGHLDVGSLQHPGQTRTVTGGALHPGDHDRTKVVDPRERSGVTSWTGWEFGVCQEFPGVGDDCYMDGVDLAAVLTAVPAGADNDDYGRCSCAEALVDRSHCEHRRIGLRLCCGRTDRPRSQRHEVRLERGFPSKRIGDIQGP
jgi:hypothetical protein